jgi:serine/threonine-protein kinase HipA
MARRRARKPLNVYLNGRLVGRLNREASGAIDFRYDAAWLGWEHTFPISLSLPLREDRYIGDAVIAVFDNLLPDNEDIRRKVAADRRAEGTDAFSLLSEVGRDCVGALQFLPEGMEPGPAGEIDARPANDEEIAAIIANLAVSPLGLQSDQEFRISLAGVQEKTALLHWNGKWHIPHGTTATTHIIKPPIGKREDVDLSLSVENEHLCLRLMAALGLPVAETEIKRFADRKVLLVERFDRVWTKDKRLLRRPQEDCCQALFVPPNLKYETDGGPGLARLIALFQGSDDPARDQKLIMKANIVFWLLAATDGHAKNFSLYLNPGGGYALTPFYDVMSVQPLFDAGQLQKNKMKLAMAIGTNRHRAVHAIAPRHFLQTAQNCGMGESVLKEIFTELRDTSESAIETATSDLPADFPPALAASIAGGYRCRLRQLTHVSGPAYSD